MNSAQPYIDAVLRNWQGSTPIARLGIVLLSGLCVIAIGGVGYWSVQPNYVVLLSEQDSNKMDRVINALDKAGIEFQLSGAGGNLLVDKRYFAKARLLARNNGAVDVAQTSDDSVMGAFRSPSERRDMARLQKQQRLAATITKIDIVDHADVHLNVPDNGPFSRENTAPTASVLVTLRPDSALSDQQANSIATFVAYAVEDLQPEGVQITDRQGRSYTIADHRSKEINNQVEYIAYAEKKLAEKAQTQLIHFLGYGNASVQVSLDMTFSEGKSTTVKYEPDGKVASEEDLVTETTSSAPSTDSGAAGVASNLQTRRGSGGKSNILSKTENIKSTYLVPKTEETKADSTPTRNYMTVSVLVNSLAEGVSDDKGTLASGLKEQVESIVKNAVGFQATDAISVEFLPFPEMTEATDPVASPFKWSDLTPMVENASLAIAALFAFLMGLLLLRRIRPLEAPAPPATNIDPAKLGNVQQLSTLIRENPEVFSRIVKLWSGAEKNEASDSPEGQQETAKAA